MVAKRPTLALVLSGGGSRGAYEAGVMQYIRNELAQRIGFQVKFDIISGTSVGAINGAYLAATAHSPETQGNGLADGWRSLTVEGLMKLGFSDTLGAVRKFFFSNEKNKPGQYRHGGILNTAGLEQFVVGFVPWKGIGQSINRGHLKALCVTATHVGTGHTMMFTQTKATLPKTWSKDPFVRHKACAIGPRHVMASASIPVLFPAVRIGKNYYTDGGLRQNTPMSPAIRLGAQKILLISLRHRPKKVDPIDVTTNEVSFPKPMFLLGKALNALLLDSPIADLERLNQINKILRSGVKHFGQEFMDKLNEDQARSGENKVSFIDHCHIAPSQDIAKIASDFVRSGKAKLQSKTASMLLNFLAGGEASEETDLLSYLLFDGTYAAQLIDLGYQDAKKREEELATFFLREFKS